MKIRKLYHPETLKYCLELLLGWRSWKLSGFWFSDKLNKKGYTLFELLFVVLLLSIVGGIGYVILHFIIKWW
jgi:prepilin-type N-terminal cleavage/methylation domain-containing protein